MKRRAIFRFSGLLIAMSIVGGLAFGVPAHAQSADERSSIALSPSSQRLTIAAGDTATGKVTVVNDGTSKETIIVYGRPYSVKSESYQPDYDSKTTNTDIYQWIRFTKASYTIEPGQTIEVPYTIQVPSGAAPGGHYGVIFVETQPDADGSDAIVRKKRVGTIILATIKGETTQHGKVLSTTAPFWQTRPPLVVSSRVESTGNTDIQASTHFKVTDLFGTTKHEVARDFTVYPGTVRRIDLMWEGAPWFGLFRTEQTISVLGRQTTATHYILLAPRWLPITLLGLLVVGVVYGWRRRRQR